jgi:hypothetical protein
MEPRDRVHGQDRQNPDRLDLWLDTALREYGKAEPRMGLENRILANLAVERTGSGTRWWVFGTAAGMAALAIMVWLVGVNHDKSVRKIASNTTSAGQNAGGAHRQSEVKRPALEAAVQRRARPHPAKRVEMADGPRLSQFPSPRPLSEQEQLLERYVRDSPGEAEMVAQAQAERRKEIEKLVADESSKINSDQQER